MERVILFFQNLGRISPEWSVFLVSTLPVAELRGGIPLGVTFHLPLWKTFLLSFLGNLVPVIPLLLFLEPVAEKFRRFRLWRKFFDWLFERTRRRARLVEKYEAIGLAIFVGIPLPMTGAWTGSIAAVIFKIRFRYALVSIIMGVIMAGIIVSLLSYGGKWLITYQGG